ncbi:MAG: protein phosphatase 2C domain-containing protein [Mycobacterium sp.]
MTHAQEVCPHCAATVLLADRFCESCGKVLSEIRSVAVPRTGRSGEGPCPHCGNETHVDGYCSVCGSRRGEPDRDEAELDGIALITDRGIEHHRNEDAGAAGVLDGMGVRPGALAAVVCDGVSTSPDSQVASSAASRAGVAAMLSTLSTSGDPKAAALAGLVAAADAAAAAQTDPSRSPSCTYTGVILIAEPDGTAGITVTNVGDSRAYWFAGAPDDAQQLTEDDTLSRQLIAAGAALTRWLGADSRSGPWTDAKVDLYTVTGPGALLLCSDGLWNYLQEAPDIARLFVDTDAVASVRKLVDHALECGGHDNITVIMKPIGAAT